MSQYSAIKAATNAYIKSNGMREITGAILNSVMIATINALGKYYQFAGVADRDTDPGSPDENVIYITGTTGTYANFGGIVVNAGEMALLKWDGTWTKQVIKIIPESTSQLLNDSGFINNAVGNLLNYYLKSETYTKGQVDDLIAAVHQFEFVVADTLPTASADTMYKIYLIPAGDSEEDNYKDEYVTILEEGVYSWEKIGSTAVDLSDYPTNEQMAQAIDDAIAAYISSINASVDSNVGTPSVDVSYSSGVLTLAFHNLKGVQGDQGVPGPPGVTSVEASVDNNTGIPSVEASVNAGVLTLTFHNLKGLQGDTGSSVDYPFTLVNNTTTDDPLQALTAAMGKYLQDQVTQLEAKVTDYATGKYYGTFPSASLLPDEMTIPGYAYVGTDNPFAIYNFDGTSWTDSGATMDGMNIPSLNPFKGMYVSVAALEAVYPNPLVGDYAYVKNSGTPATANIYSESGGAWTDTGIVVSITDMESVFPMYAKLQLLYTLEKVAWTDGNAPTYLSDLRTALLGSVTLVSVDATFTPGTAVILDTMSLDDLRQYLVVAATLSDGSVEVVTGYQLSGLMTTGTNTITVTYLGKTDTFSVNVVHNYAGLLSTWTLHPASSVAEYTNGAVRMKCANTTDQDGYGVWCADCKTSLWSAVNGKTLKFRVKANSKSASVVLMGAGVFENANITSLGATKAKRKSFAENDLTLSADGYYEINFVCDINNFTNGTLTPNASSTFGLYAYARSLQDYIEFYDLQVFEVTP